MPLGFSLLGRPKPSAMAAAEAANANAAAAVATAASGSLDGDNSFRLTFLGKQALNRPTNTGFGSVQKPLREIYLASLSAGKEPGGQSANERTFVFEGPELRIRFWDAGARRFQQEVWPLDCVTYLDLVFFHTVKGRKRHFGYFRRHTDPVDVVPDAVLIPLHKREAKRLAKLPHRPILCFLIRRPYGIQFLECHTYQAESEAVGRAFINRFDGQTRAKQSDEKASRLFNYAPWQPAASSQDSGLRGKWASQPALAHLQQGHGQGQLQSQPQQEQQQSSRQMALAAGAGSANQRAVGDRRLNQSSSNVSLIGCQPSQQQQRPSAGPSSSSQAEDSRQPRHRSSSSSASSASGTSGTTVALLPGPDGAFVVVDSTDSGRAVQSQHHNYLHPQQQQHQPQPQQPMRRSASGTIFDKYQELRAFNMPEYEYMGFQEMQQQLELRRQQRLQQEQQKQQQPRLQPATPQHQRQPTQPPPPSPSVGLGGGLKFPSDSNLARSASAREQAPPHQPQQQQQQQPQQQPQQQQRHAIQRRQRTPAHQAVAQQRPSTILEESQLRGSMLAAPVVGGQRQQQPEQQPHQENQEELSNSSVASLVSRFERIQQSRPQQSAVAEADGQQHQQQQQQQHCLQQQQQALDDRNSRPVALVFPTSRDCQQQQQQSPSLQLQQLKTAPAHPQAAGEIPRLLRTVQSNSSGQRQQYQPPMVQSQQQNSFASALGYLP